MRKCWNRQTGTLEVRVSMTCGFKSHLPHHYEKPLSGHNDKSRLTYRQPAFVIVISANKICNGFPPFC